VPYENLDLVIDRPGGRILCVPSKSRHMDVATLVISDPKQKKNVSSYFKLCCGADWLHLAQDRCQWRVIVKTIMNLGIT
jgi:hypothetical protein